MAFGQFIINYWAVLLCAVASIVLGSLWYGPFFGKIWIKLSKFSAADMKKAQKAGMGKSYFLAFLGSLLTAYVLVHFVKYVGAITALDAIQLAFWLWLGFIITAALGTVLWEGKSWTLYLINVGYHLVLLIIMSLILTLWQ